MPRDGVFGAPILVFARGLPGRRPHVAGGCICDLDPRLVGAGGHGKGTGSVGVIVVCYIFICETYLMVGLVLTSFSISFVMLKVIRALVLVSSGL